VAADEATTALVADDEDDGDIDDGAEAFEWRASHERDGNAPTI
jgi:hypothetical protein